MKHPPVRTLKITLDRVTHLRYSVVVKRQPDQEGAPMSLRETIESDRTMQDAKSEFSLFCNEHYRLLEVFERQFAHLGRMEKEPKDLWAKGFIYQDGHVNEIFLAFRRGYAYGKAFMQQRQPAS